VYDGLVGNPLTDISVRPSLVYDRCRPMSVSIRQHPENTL